MNLLYLVQFVVLIHYYFQKMESSENPFCGYSKVDQLALLAFQVGKVLEQQDSDSCPLPEAYTIISLLKKHGEKYLSC